MNQAKPQIFAWRPRRNTTGTLPSAGAYWFLNLGNQPVFSWRPRTHTTGTQATAGKWFLNLGNMPIWRWDRSPAVVPHPTERIVWTVGGVGTASFVGTIPQRGAVTISGVGTASFVPRGAPVHGILTCQSVGQAQFLVGLDTIIYTCLTKGDKPAAVVHIPNFVY